jgi:hypothetical protein
MAMLTISSPVVAQTSILQEQPLLGSTLSADVLQDLPTSNSPFAVLENIQSEAIGDRFSAGGLNVATAPRFGAFLNSWTQTQYRIGDIVITDPRAGGTPLFLPVLPLWERLTTMTGAMAVDENAPGLSMTLEPRRPGSSWSRSVEGTFSAPALVSDVPGAVPVVDAVRQWQDWHAMISGPMSDRLGLLAAGSWRRLSHVAASSPIETSDTVASGFAHVVFAATPRDQIRTIGWVQHVTTPAVEDTAVHVQSTWSRNDPGRMPWRAFAGYTRRSRSTPAASMRVVDSLTSDPVSDVIDADAGTVHRWVVGARATPRSLRLPTFGADFEGAQTTAAPTDIQQIGELVDGVPARLWTVHAGGSNDRRHATTLSAFGNEHLTFGALTLDAGLRLEAVAAAADASASGIQWATWLPRTMLRWQIVGTGGLAAVVSYRRFAYQLPLNVLAIGDPAAPVADISRWSGASIGPLIARVGPGTGGDASFTRIDPQLQRPTTDELMLAAESRPTRWLQLELAGIVKRERTLIGLVDSLPLSSYAAFQVPDPSFEPGSPQGGPFVTVYNRPPDSYGRDRYLLTNQVGDPATFWGIDVNIRTATDRLMVLAGGTIWTRTAAPAAAVGFLPTENDQDILGSLFVDPNAATQARGQVFPDRSHTAKVAVTYRLPWRIRLGALARYQDGQPFARLVIVPELNQGPTPVRAYANGGTAFTYTGTLDLRVQKLFTAGRSEVAAILDVYNLPNLGNEVTERVVSGAMFRAPTALQPSRTALVGLRVTF